tara:strand:+ start:811 stop:1677 length:867 start_codon:yes stop_codon:yes gene_type:complete
MEGLDLNIDNYEYEDILKLFELKTNFRENDLRNAKKKVLMMHPDKSGLDKKYFLFFSSAFKILHSVYEFREKASKDLNEEIEYLAEKNEENQELVDKLRDKYNTKDFNKWFNKEFEKVKLENDFESNGYGDWLKNEEEVEVCQNRNEMNEAIDKKKRDLRSIISYNGINEYNGGGGYNDLANNRPEEYSSGMFSKLQYEDLKKAHVESVIPVTEEDNKVKYNSMEDIKIKRQQQNLKPLSEEMGRDYLNNKKISDDYIGAQRAFKLATQEREALKGSNKFWSSLKQIK